MKLNEDFEKNLKTNKEELGKLRKEFHLLSIRLKNLRKKSEPLENEINNYKVIIPSIKDKISLLLEELDKIYR